MSQHNTMNDGIRAPAGLRQSAVERMRAGIIGGRFPAGSQLPTFDALVEEYGLSRATMQLVVKQLKDEGFVRSVHRSGLFVTERPPHLHRFGIAFAEAPGERGWNRFMRALLAESAVVAGRQAGVELVPYFGLRAGNQSRDLERLLNDAAHQQLAGVIVTSETHFLFEHPEVGAGGIPCVGINFDAGTVPAPVVNTDDGLFLRKALGWLVAQGRKRVAVLAMRPLSEAEGPNRVDVELCRRAGLETRPHWLCPLGNEHKGQVRAVVRLLLDYPEQERPDALLIATDNLVEEALNAVHGSGVVIGRDMDVVAHCNWPWAVDSPLPIARLGFHSHHFLERCLEAIRAMRRGEEFPALTALPALFEHEL